MKPKTSTNVCPFLFILDSSVTVVSLSDHVLVKIQALYLPRARRDVSENNILCNIALGVVSCGAFT